MAGINVGQSAASYLSEGLSPSFTEKFTTDTGFSPSEVVDLYQQDLEFGVDITGDFNSVAEALSGLGALATAEGWTFITAPEDISWEVSNGVKRMDMYGTNNPPAVAGARGMRDLTLSNSLTEGFVRGVSLEGKVAALENLLNYELNTSDGFVRVPVYQVWANEKSYGGTEAYYVIKSVNIKEKMRDTKGNVTRALVDISLMQVPAYQVDKGRDQAGKAALVPGAILTPEQQAGQKIPGKGSTTSPSDPGAKSPSGPNGPSASTPSTDETPAASLTGDREGITVYQELNLKSEPRR